MGSGVGMIYAGNLTVFVVVLLLLLLLYHLSHNAERSESPENK